MLARKKCHLLAGAVVVRSLRRLDRLQAAMQDVASGDGDLTKRLDASGHDELARIAQGFNAFVDKIQATLREIRATSDAVHEASREIASGNHDLSSRTESAASSLQQTSATMEEMTSAVAQSAQSAQEANQIAGGQVFAHGHARQMDDPYAGQRSVAQGSQVEFEQLATGVPALTQESECRKGPLQDCDDCHDLVPLSHQVAPKRPSVRQEVRLLWSKIS